MRKIFLLLSFSLSTLLTVGQELPIDPPTPLEPVGIPQLFGVSSDPLRSKAGGSLEVGPSGALFYTLPLELLSDAPRLQPSLSVSYNS